MGTYKFSSDTQSFLENIPIPLAVYQYVDHQIKPLLVSKAYIKLFGYNSCQEAVYCLNTDLYRNIHPDDIVRMEEYSYDFATQDDGYDVVFRNKREDQSDYHIIHGTGKHISVNGASIAFITYTDETADAGNDEMVKAVLTTLSDKYSPSESTEFTKHYDELTGLHNMTHFLDYAGPGIEKMWEKGQTPVVMYFDLCDLKVYNRRYGLKAGDQQICSLGKLIKEYFQEDKSSRFESDHFVAYAGDDQIESRLMDLFSQMKDLNGGNNLAIKVGLFKFQNDGTRLTDACDRARLACESIPKTNTSVFEWFDDEIMENASFKYYIIRNFDKALKNRWIQVYYQPIVRTMTKTVCNGEVLVRWIDPERGVISPSRFIPILEETGQIYKMDLYVFEEACKGYSSGTRTGREMVPVSVNLSRKDFLHDDLPDTIDKISRKYGVPREFTNIEITESAFVKNIDKVDMLIERFHHLGYRVWMDDFGSGYSSLGVLNNYSFDEIKIDMSFLREFDEKSRKIITSIVRMAKALEISTLAEGVETEEQYLFLRKIGCEKIQGYYFGRPRPLDESLEQLKRSGLAKEPAKWRNYFSKMSRIDYLTDKPLCVVDDDGEKLNLIFANQIYIDILREDNVASLKDWERKNNTLGDPIHIFHRHFADQQLRKLKGPQITAYPSGDHYMQLTGSVVAVQDNHYLYTVQIQYVTLKVDDYQQIRMESMSNLYYMCNDIAIYDLENNTVEGIKSSLSDQPMGVGVKLRDVNSVVNSWTMNYCYLPDQKRFAEFMDISTLRARLINNKDRTLTGMFRSITASGEYRWFLHLIVPVQRSDFNRAVHVTLEVGVDEEGIKKVASALSDGESDYLTVGITDEVLWKNLILNARRMYFWKDDQRRFLGASRSFLKYFGLSSDKEIIGKTDEDMGWHIDPVPFKNDEEEVISTGKKIYLRNGKCIVNGMNRDIITSKVPIYRDGKIIGILGSVADAELTSKFLQREHKLTAVDEVACLANARGLSDSIYTYLNKRWRTGSNVALMEVYVPEYREIVNLYGDDSGNCLLREVGMALKKAAGKGCVIGRVQESLFYILMNFECKEDVRNVARKIRPAIESLRKAGQWSGNCSVEIRASYADESSNDRKSYISGLSQLILNTKDHENL